MPLTSMTLFLSLRARSKPASASLPNVSPKASARGSPSAEKAKASPSSCRSLANNLLQFLAERFVCGSETALSCGVFLLAAQGGQRRRFTRRDHIRRLAEIVPHEWFHVRLDDDVRLRAPGEIGMTLNDVECTAENIGEGARLLDVGGFEIDGNDDVRAQEQCALDRHRRGQESIHQRPPLILDGQEQTGVRAGSAKRRRNCAV